MNELSIFNRFPTLFPQIFDKNFEDVFTCFDRELGRTEALTYPTDIYDKYAGDKKIATVVEIAAAGFKKDECKVSVKDDILTLKLVKQDNKNPNDGEGITRKYHAKKIAYRTATFSWTLAQNVDKEKISVKYEDGVLKIELPIIQPDEPKEKVIEIE